MGCVRFMAFRVLPFDRDVRRVVFRNDEGERDILKGEKVPALVLVDWRTSKFVSYQSTAFLILITSRAT